jgi:hypothetical protein
MAEKKKPKPGPSTGGKVTSRIDRPKGTQPLTLGSGGLRTGKVSKKQQEGTRKVLANIAVTAIGGGVAGAIGKAATRAVAKSATPKAAVALNRSRGAGRMVNPKAPTGKKVSTAPKRDVVVKTEDKTLAVKGRFIDKSGHKSVKVNTNKPTARTIKPEVTKKQADRYTKQTSNMRRKQALKDANTAMEEVAKSNVLRNAGRVSGATATAGATNYAQSRKKKK